MFMDGLMARGGSFRTIMMTLAQILPFLGQLQSRPIVM
jgi:hypothetical protein